MNKGKYVFAQLMSLIDSKDFAKCVARYQVNYRVRSFACWHQFLCMSFGQLTYRDSLRDIVLCLASQQKKLYHLGISQGVKKSTLAAFYVMDRGNVDFKRLYHIHQSGAYFVVRAKNNLAFIRLYSHQVDKETGLRCDQIIKLKNYYASQDYPEHLRRVKFYDKEHNQTYVYLTNNFEAEALQLAILYLNRWKVEIFFKWIKQNLKIKSFWGESPNAVKTQIWITICTLVLAAILKKRLNCSQTLNEVLQILSICIFDKVRGFGKRVCHRSPRSRRLRT
jgi:hypothetical protein